MYVVSGVMSGWNMSVENVTSGGRLGYESGKEIWKRKTAVAYGPVSMGTPALLHAHTMYAPCTYMYVGSGRRAAAWLANKVQI